MATDPSTIIANCDVALADVSSSGIVRYTMPDGRSVEKSVDDVLKIKSHFEQIRNANIAGAGSRGGKSYATFARPR